ncbi:hypothetical protein MBM_03031 [Drepanopeziza brunnea f. sp. 'multigermtubi' MB_m1]|uniref:Uncharacterized protein n=2 Tax=Drepanopeziza brunnea f. sp. 'multigermtubi' TaxID=698441 RepID=K1Y0Y1_MARBU|nr:uncharacterized protein MBM_03031 [Drepanopeziza brunnea f. sp. 'multigermtubi' MB_m1]EKD18789.1 hypothetical protein MBM_03031 [Drepanopeziza brunnea f. sp. 'multigermtubi' MB_m1]
MGTGFYLTNVPAGYPGPDGAFYCVTEADVGKFDNAAKKWVPEICTRTNYLGDIVIEELWVGDSEAVLEWVGSEMENPEKALRFEYAIYAGEGLQMAIPDQVLSDDDSGLWAPTRLPIHIHIEKATARPGQIDILALQSNTYGGGSVVAAPMAQPDAEPVEEYEYEGLPPNFSLLQNMTAGAFAGIAEHTVMYPIDAIKTRMQILNPTPSAVYNGMIQGGYRIATGEGFLSLWRGMSSVVVGAGPAHAVYFATYEAVKHVMGGNQAGVHHPLAAATSGACATIASDALMNPFDVIKQRMQIHNSSKMYKSMFDCARYVYRSEGVSAFYVSYPTTLSMTVPFTALQFLAYESISTVMNPSKNYDPMTHCSAGAVAGGFAAALTTPMDVVKTMLQTRGTAKDPELRAVNSFMSGARLLRRREGLMGFFKGVKPRVVTTMPSTAICWSAYEACKAYFIKQNDTVV